MIVKNYFNLFILPYGYREAKNEHAFRNTLANYLLEIVCVFCSFFFYINYKNLICI